MIYAPTPSWQAALGAIARGEEQTPRAMPAGFYNDPNVLDFEIEHLFLNGWLCVGRADEVPQPGDYFTLEMLGEPLVITRDKDNQVRVLSNVCRHRGSIIMKGSGNSAKFTCPYHKWTYALDGKLMAAPLMDESTGLDTKACALPSFRTAEWMGYVFVNLDGKAEDFADSVQGINPYVKNYHNEEMLTVQAGPEHWPVNWKLLAENFLEGYHLTPVHLNTLHPMCPTKLCEKVEGGPGFTGYKAHYSDNFEGRAPFHPDTTEEERNLSMMVWIYPGFVAAFSPNSTVFMSITPTGPDSLQTRWGVAAHKDTFESGEAQQRYDFAGSFNAEDKERLVDVHKGLSTTRYSGRGHLAPADYEGTIWDFYQYVAKRLPIEFAQKEQ